MNKIIIAAIFFLACSKPAKTALPVSDTVVLFHPHLDTLERINIDSTLHYFGMEMEYHSDYQLAAARYYSTEQEKYRLQANRFRDSSHKYYLLLKAYSNKFK